ncbi:peptide deformylase [Mizugakiibacter sediminis]|uniref:N-formylmethionyl-tRNA deformylase n=1 Tax=Mizugakiibacter sediminis TaxID=1475481 RepID=A0A0K8QPG0_9GAMM|nr:peptide deformylase [Mizugakiibacter sediminis]GAP66774.1 peptide deformylase [Mizugakiibacter sediminis]
MPVDFGGADLSAHQADLAAALSAFRASHGWGRAVALPQLGVAKRIVAFDLGGGPFFAINPVIEWQSPETFEVWDDCMCLPEIAVRVRRSRSLTLEYLDANRKRVRLERVSEDLSELIQHEMDHLEGVLLTDRMLPEWGVVAREARDRARPIKREP